MKHPYPSNIRDLVTNPFMDLSADVDYHDLLKMPNKNGTTPKTLLDALNKLIYDDTMEDSDSSDSSSNNSQKVSTYLCLDLQTSSTNVGKVSI